MRRNYSYVSPSHSLTITINDWNNKSSNIIFAEKYQFASMTNRLSIE